MRLVSVKCPNCGSNLELDADSKQAFCTFCGTKILLDDEVQHHQVHYDNAEDAGYQFEKGRQRAQAEANANQPQTVIVQNVVQQKPKKRKTFWWVMGWIFIFPIPLTILLVRNKKLNKLLKIILILVAWVLYFGIAASASSNNRNNTDKQGGSSAPTNSTSSDRVDISTQESVPIVTKSPTPVTPTSTATATEPAQTVFQLSAGSYVFGVDIPAGRAKVSGISGTGNVLSSDYDGLAGINSMVMTDSSGKASMPNIFESYTFEKGAYLYISQTAVVQFEFTNITSSSSGRKYSEQTSYELVSGSYTVGIDIEPGTYRVVATSGQGNFIAGNYLKGGANEVMGVDSPELYNNVFGNVILKKDDTVVLTLTLHVSLYKSED